MSDDIDVQTCDDIKAQVAKAPTELRRRQYLIKKAIDFGCSQHIPDEWEVDINVGNTPE